VGDRERLTEIVGDRVFRFVVGFTLRLTVREDDRVNGAEVV